MSDIFREVDEDLRRDRFGKLWKRFAPFIIAVAVLIVVGTAGYRYWENRQVERSQEAGDALLEAIDAGSAGDHAVAAQDLAKLDDAIGGYPVLARMRKASELASAGEKDEALKAFEAVSDDTSVDKPVRDVAAIRAGYLAVDLETLDQVAKRIEPLTDAANALRAAAWEIMGLAAWKSGDIEAAGDWFGKILDDANAPIDVANRARMMDALVKASLESDTEKSAVVPGAPAKASGQAASDAKPTEGDAQ